MAATTAQVRREIAKMPFPAAAVREALQQELIRMARTLAEIEHQTLPEDTEVLLAHTNALDSLGVVGVLCVLDEILSFEVGESVVRAGGYESIKDAMDHVIPRIEQEWAKHHTGG